MKKFLPLLLCAVLCLSSCISPCKKKLKGIDRHLREDPALALRQLDSLGYDALRTPSEKALFSLLKSISLDMLDINIASDSIIAPAVKYYARHGSKSHRMKSLLYLGRTQWYAGDNEAAILSFTKAKDLAKKLGDDMHTGLALSSAANTYNRDHNTDEEYNAHTEALEYFKKTGEQHNIHYTQFQIGTVLYLREEYDAADSILTESMNFFEEEGDTVDYIDCASWIAQLLLEKDPKDVGRALGLFDRILEIQGSLGLREWSQYAYAKALEGDLNEAFEIFEQFPKDTASLYEYGLWYYNTLALAKDFERANEVLLELNGQQYAIATQALKDSAIKTQRDYFSQVSEAQTIKRLRLILLGSALIFVLVLAIIFVLSMVRKERQRRMDAEGELRSLSEEAKRSRDLADEEIGSLKSQLAGLRTEAVHLYKSKFEIIGKLSESYVFNYSGKPSIAFAENEMLPIFKSIKEGSGKGSGFEALIDASLNKAMTRLRKGLSSFKEEDFVFLSYMIAGFSTPLIAKLLDMQKADIHTKKHRLLQRIERAGLPDKEELMEYIR